MRSCAHAVLPGAGHYPGELGPGIQIPVLLTAIGADGGVPVPTGVGELDRVLGGGLMPGSATLIGGEPGIGKSTLLLQAWRPWPAGGARCLLVSRRGVAGPGQLAGWRLDALVPGLWLVGETSHARHPAPPCARSSPDVVVVDSIQTVWDPELESGPGSVARSGAAPTGWRSWPRPGGPAVVLVGHVTKEGALAGPRVLEHLVDTVLSFEGDRHHALRLLRAVKHRFGPTGELGLFEMTGRGLRWGGRCRPALFLADRRPGRCGSVVFPTMEGQRPLLVEIQALVVSSPMAEPAPLGVGFRLRPSVAASCRAGSPAGVSLGHHDVYVSVVGGVRVGRSRG